MFLYNFVIHLFYLAMRFAAMFKPKAKLWINGRSNWEIELNDAIKKFDLKHAAWMHCASLGEFEQGRPLLQKIRQENSSQKIVLTFFSPSGYEIQKNFSTVDYVCYLPLDSVKNSKRFIDALQPKVAIFVKYEFWLNFLFQLQIQKIPTFLISTVIKKHQPFFKWYGKLFRNALASFHTIYTQDKESLQLLNTLHINTGILTGDTRFDRVLDVCQFPKKIDSIAHFADHAFVIIAGSSWQTDETYLIESFLKLKPNHPQLKLIIAPHEIDLSNIERLKKMLVKNEIPFHLFSEQEKVYTHSVLILNTMGILSSVYQYGTIAFVGGGFNNGIHNILEPSVFGLPVLFGVNHHKFNEASDMLALKAGFEISSEEDLTKQIKVLLKDNVLLDHTAHLAKSYVLNNSGATNLIYLDLKKQF
jgi:3-deoxy-D-manno-octulosonic-acid transferase